MLSCSDRGISTEKQSLDSGDRMIECVCQTKIRATLIRLIMG